MKLMSFVQMLQGVLHKLIDETEQKATAVKEDDIPDYQVLDEYSFDYLINLLTDMKKRYILFKTETADQSITYEDNVVPFKVPDDGDQFH